MVENKSHETEVVESQQWKMCSHQKSLVMVEFH